MSFEKKMKKRANKKLNEFAKNPYHTEPHNHHFPLWGKILVPAVSFTALLVIGVSVFVPMMRDGVSNKGAANHDGTNMPTEGSQNINSGVGEGSTPTNGSNKGGTSGPNKGFSERSYTNPEGTSNDLDQYTAIPIPPWSEKTLTQRYPCFVYLDNQYSARDPDDCVPVNSQYVNEKVGTVNVTGHDVYDDRDYVEEAELYSIKNISTDASLAIKFKDSTDYYSYQNIYCYFATLGELVDKIGMETEVEFAYVNYARNDDETGDLVIDIHKDIEKSRVMEILFDDLTIACNDSAKKPYLSSSHQSSGSNQGRQYSGSLAINVTIKALNIENAGMQLYNDGSLFVNIFNYTYDFDLGVERYELFKDYVLNNN